MNLSIFIRKTSILLVPGIIFFLNACAPALGGGTVPTPTEGGAAVAIPTSPETHKPTQALLRTQAPLTTQTPEGVSGELVACRPALCSDPAFWELTSNGPVALPLSVKPGLSYDATSATGRLLYSTKARDRGAGPGNVSVGDLWWLDVRSGQTRPVISDQVVVKAAWGPTGQNFAYVRATSTTYELHWYTGFGEDKLLAKDTAFTFSVSPAGDQIAFTRESGYGLNAVPGLYVVSIATGQERQISTVDRAGTGSAGDEPLWSPDGKHILLSVTGEVYNGWIMAATDGSGAAQLKLSQDASKVLQNDNLGFALWSPDAVHLIGSSFPGMEGGGKGKILTYGLNQNLDTLISAVVLNGADSVPVSWNKPGESVWVRSPDGSLESMPVK